MSNNTGIFSKFERDELNKITAKSILEKLMNTRQNINVEFIARRLIWELIQNAKDNASLCSDQGEAVDIRIKLYENEFIFSHSNGYFTNEHIRGLIRKYSSSDKERDGEQLGLVYKTTGRFGTGFMTTHLLSEKVKVESYYRNEPDSFNHFSFWLDRTGKTEAKIIEGINNAFDEAEASIKNSASTSVVKGDLRTSFIYPLSDQKKGLARIALREVEKSVAYTLINIPEINSINIDEDLIGETLYNIELIDTLSYQQHELQIHNLMIDGETSGKYYLSIHSEDVKIIVPLSKAEDGYHALELDHAIPRLHLDFPMIGTEDLHLPFVVNSPLFEPTEPRDGISLINDQDNEVSQLNCSIILKGVELYGVLLSYVSEELWGDLYNLARIRPPKKHTWIDHDWFTKEVVDSLREKLLYIPIVDVVDGSRISIWNEESEANAYFPYADDSTIREKIWKLAKKLYPQSVPVQAHVDKWHVIIWKDCCKFSISALSGSIQEEGSLEALADSLNGDEQDAINFLNDYYRLLNLEGKHIKDIIADEFAVIPNQLGKFDKKTKLHVDKSIDEEIKKACALVTTDPKEYLAHKYANTGDGILYPPKKQEHIIAEMNNIIKENKFEKVPVLCDYLASLFPQNNIPERRVSIFDFSKKIFPGDFTERRSISQYDEKIWEESDKKSIGYLVASIASCKTVQKICSDFNFDTEEIFLQWLDSFVTFLVKEGFESNINKEKYPILPNQNGVLCIKDNLFLDEGDIGDELKDIASELGHDFRKEILDPRIFLELPANRTYSIVNVAEKISTFVKPILRDVDKRKQYGLTLKKLYLWMNENREAADEHFSDLFEKRFLFLEDDDISLNIRKATELDQLLQEHGLNSLTDLRSALANLRETGNVPSDETEKIDITKEILVSLGISSKEQLEEAFKDPAISSRFFHTSTPTVDMFLYAQRLIQRAKANIIEYLQNHPDYDCTELEETADTILAGITKNGIPIEIVMRPSDNGEVIIYYSSEKDTLDSDSSELWVDNGIIDPHILTLGRILKSTGINRIPINMN